ncbi:hypothetical protein [uncultured Nitrosomonas sp.]|uniref:hypothetical protein n=1 Tax=uncultured Nitrosomonas sp. TaxID=156424 RepID=UPI0025FF0DA6|nr:hypothetical protein [uncultured Nitrosomonas sp.]
MKITPKENLSDKGQIILDSLQQAVTKTLERKRRLGQYAVIWQNGKPVMIGEDAPESSENSTR